MAVVWSDENVSYDVFVVSDHLHSPSGRVGPSGPESGNPLCKKYGFQLEYRPTRPLSRRTSPRGGKGGGAHTFVSPTLRCTSAQQAGCLPHFARHPVFPEKILGRIDSGRDT